MGIVKIVPINVGILLLYRLQSVRHFFIITIIAVFQFKYLISKSPYHEIFKMWSIMINVGIHLVRWSGIYLFRGSGIHLVRRSGIYFVYGVGNTFV